MKRIVFGILFLFSVVWAWSTIGEKDMFAVEQTLAECTQTSTASGHQDQLISVVTEANSYAEISARTTSSFSSVLARRYRPAGFSLDKWLHYLVQGQKTTCTNRFKTTLELSQEYAARIKYTGYYLYTLRKIVI